MHTFFPSSASLFATHSTSGLFPVPPAVMLPTLITGRSRETVRKVPRRYKESRARVTAPYKALSGGSIIGASDFMNYARFSPPRDLTRRWSLGFSGALVRSVLSFYRQLLDYLQPAA